MLKPRRRRSNWQNPYCCRASPLHACGSPPSGLWCTGSRWWWQIRCRAASPGSSGWSDGFAAFLRALWIPRWRWTSWGWRWWRAGPGWRWWGRESSWAESSGMIQLANDLDRKFSYFCLCNFYGQIRGVFFLQWSIRIGQWPISWYTSTMKIHKIIPSVDYN